ncbi:unnamed protein product [Vicia faba]|uniref:Uncharacterized protein n=1 Tax=Vicia faba TaxID=3906 RepID=A0AAV0Z3J2_VICFA|nr:unnamed protein product [Vicia faba]
MLLVTEEIKLKSEVYHGDGLGQVKSKELFAEICLPNGLLPLKNIIEVGYNIEIDQLYSTGGGSLTGQKRKKEEGGDITVREETNLHCRRDRTLQPPLLQPPTQPSASKRQPIRARRSPINNRSPALLALLLHQTLDPLPSSNSPPNQRPSNLLHLRLSHHHHPSSPLNSGPYSLHRIRCWERE